jgi:lipoate-protein ligase A
MDKWRLIPLLDAPGQVQMAIDHWLLEQHRQGLHPPTLRFYTWSPVAISLGYHQHRYPEFWQGLTWQGKPIELVRRPSGGRAVLHQGDLTYAVIGSGFASNRTRAYEEICQVLIEGMRSLNIPLYYGQAGRSYRHNPNCFGTATVADLITEEGIKLIGSAQLRRDNAVLQHGSIRLAPDPQLFQQVFEEAVMPFQLPPPPAIMHALVKAAAQQFQAEFVVQALRPEEISAAQNLERADHSRA